MQVVRKIIALGLMLSVLYTGYTQSVNSFPVSGKVTDAATGQGIRVVRITYKNVAATMTDSLGNSSFKVPGWTNILFI